MVALSHLLPLSLLTTTTLSFSLNPLNLLPRASSADSKLNYVFFVNCWANPGARSEVDYFTSYPTNFGSATPDASTVVSSNENFEWENGGSASDPDNGNISWNTLTKNASTNSQAGTASDGSIKYMVLRDTDSTLYTDGDFNCIVVYRLQQSSGGQATTTEPPSSNSTSTSTASETAAAATTTLSAGTSATPSSTGGAVTTTQQSSGLSTGAQAGIGAGVGAVALALIAGAAIWFFRRRKAKGYKSGEPMTGVFSEKNGLHNGEGAGGATEGGTKGQRVAELHQDPVVELGGEGRVGELQANEPWSGGGERYELDGGS